MDIEKVRLALTRVKRSTGSVDVLLVCEFAEECLGSKPRLSEVEKRLRNRERVRRWRAKQKENPFEV